MKFLRFFSISLIVAFAIGSAHAQEISTLGNVVTISDSTSVTASTQSDSIPTYRLRPRPSRFMYGFTAGVGYQFNTGSLRSNFSNSVLFNLGIFAGYRQLRFKVNGTFAQPSFRNINIFNQTTEITTADGPRTVPTQANGSAHASQFGVSLMAGVAVYDSRWLTITPFVGYNFKSHSWNIDVLEWVQNDAAEWKPQIIDVERASLSSHSFIASIDFDIKLRRKFTSLPFLGDSGLEQYTHAIRISPFITRERYSKCSPAVSGWVFGFSVAYCGIARALSL